MCVCVCGGGGVFLQKSFYELDHVNSKLDSKSTLSIIVYFLQE